MSTEVGRIVGVLEVQDEASATIGKFNAAANSLFGTMNQLGGGIASVGSVAQSAFAGFATGGPVGAAIGAGGAAISQLVGYMQDSVKEAAAAQQAMQNLAIAVEKSGTSWALVSQGTQDALASLQKTTVFSDEQVAGALQRLLTMGLSYDQAMKSLATTIDFAAAKHLDLETAATVVGKAVDGNVGLLARYGVNVDESAVKTEGFTAVLGALNDQFGGTAVAQAETYAGTQERLKNAMSDLSEKVGTLLLPALSSLTEGMIPVVDSFSKGVDAVQSWLTEVGKMPEVQAASDALGKAFEGIKTFAGDLWTALSEELGPVLKDLMDSFKELWDALQPIGEAIGELVAAFGGAGEGGIKLRDIIGLMVEPIKLLAAGIREIAPIIKLLGEGFKAAADIIAPAIRTMVDLIGGFLKWLHESFDAFYQWFVGASLWTDLWNKALDIVDEIGTKILDQFTGGWFSQIKDTVSKGVGDIQKTWETGINELPKLTSGALDLMTGNWEQGIQKIKTSTTNVFDSLPAPVQQAVTTVGNTMQGGMDQLQSIVEGFKYWLVGEPAWMDIFEGMEQITETGGDKVTGKFSQTVKELQQVADATLGQTVNILGKKIDTMQASVEDLGAHLSDITDKLLGAMQYLVDLLMRALGQSAASLKGTAADMTSNWGTSLTGMNTSTGQMMSSIASVIHSAIESILNDFRRARAEMAQGLPVGGGGFVASSGGGGSTSGGGAAPSGGGGSSVVTVPVNVYLGPSLVASQVENRITTRIVPSEREIGRRSG